MQINQFFPSLIKTKNSKKQRTRSKKNNENQSLLIKLTKNYMNLKN